MNEHEKHQYLLAIGQRIKNLRELNGLSQAELAKKSGYTSRSTINKIELGLNDLPQSKLKTIATSLNCSVSNLLFDFNKDNFCKLYNICKNSDGQNLITNFAKLDVLDQGKILGIISYLLADTKYVQKNENEQTPKKKNNA